MCGWLASLNWVLLQRTYYIVSCETRVYSWNTYPVRLFIMNMLPDVPDRFRVCLYFRVHVVDLLTVNTTCDFERGGAKKQIIGSS